jgi:hypothetical protein
MTDQNPMDYNATVAELRNIREQQENFYFRDIERKFEEAESTKKKKRTKEKEDELGIEFRRHNIHRLNDNLIDSISNRQELEKDTTELIVAVLAILTFCVLIATATYLLTR